MRPKGAPSDPLTHTHHTRADTPTISTRPHSRAQLARSCFVELPSSCPTPQKTHSHYAHAAFHPSTETRHNPPVSFLPIAEVAALCDLLGHAGGTPPPCVWDAVLRTAPDGLASVDLSPVLALLGRNVLVGGPHGAQRVVQHLKQVVEAGGGGASALSILRRLEGALSHS